MVFRARRHLHCFTLVEILVVMAILALLMGIGIGGYGLAMSKAKRSKTETLIKKLEVALEAVKAKHGYYFQGSTMVENHFLIPEKVIDLDDSDGNDDLDGTNYEAVFPDLKALETFIKAIDFESFKNANTKKVKIGTKEYLVVIDAWENPIYYKCPGEKNTGTFDILSAGSDKLTANGTPVQDKEELWESDGTFNSSAAPKKSKPKESNDIANF